MRIDFETRRDHREPERFFGPSLPVELGFRRATRVYGLRLLFMLGAGVLPVIAAAAAFLGLAPVLVAWTVLLISVTGGALWQDLRMGAAGGREARLRARFLFPTMFALLAATAVVSAASAAPDFDRSDGAQIVVCGIAMVTLVLLSKVVLVRTEVASEKTIEQARQAVALTRAAQPLITALGQVASAGGAAERRMRSELLVRLTVGVVQSVCGRSVTGTEHTRGMFYQLHGDDQVVLRAYEGSYEGRQPRAEFDGRNSLNERRVVEIAKGDRVIVVNDLDASPPVYFSGQERPYKSYIAVPVRAGDRPFGVLMVDSDTPNSLSDVDIGYAILVAGILAAGLAIADPQAASDPTVRPDVNVLDDIAQLHDTAFEQEVPSTAVAFSLSPEGDREFLRVLGQKMPEATAPVLEDFRRQIITLAEDSADRKLRLLNLKSTRLVWVESSESLFDSDTPGSRAGR